MEMMDGMGVKVSVIVPVYNAEAYIQDTMQMLCQSALNEIEVIAVNDGSTDKSLSVLKGCAEKDSRIRVFDKPNGGIFDARNRGLQEASGEYICFCDQDDIVEPQMYEKMYQKAIETQSELVMCSTGRNVSGKKVPYWAIKDLVFENQKVQEECFLPLIFNKGTIYQNNEKIAVNDSIWKCMVLNQFIKRNNLIFRKYVDYEDDRIFLMDILARAKKVACVSDVFYYWTVDLNSESHAPRYKENLYEKDLDLQNETIKIMEKAGCNVGQIKQFEEFNSAYRYSRLVENEVNNKSAKPKQRLANVKLIYKEECFKDNAKAARYYPRNMFARKIVCRFLQRKCTALAYGFWKTYQALRYRNQNKPFWTKVENTVRGGVSDTDKR